MAIDKTDALLLEQIEGPPVGENAEQIIDSTRLKTEKLERVAKIFNLVEKINESGESLPFPGINPEDYIKMKKGDEKDPGYTTPTDEIIERCKKEGIKVCMGKDPKSGNVFVLPAGSNNIGMDDVAPYQLEIDNVTNEHLKELIRLTGNNRKL